VNPAIAIYLAILGSPDCDQMIELSGPPALVGEVRLHLLRSGGGGCRAVKVALEEEAGGGISVSMDVGGTVVNRTATTPEIAAVLVESWASEEGPGRVIRPVELEPRRLEVPVIAKVEVAEEKKTFVRVSAAGELSVASDGTLWYGPAATACSIVGYFCGGASLRYAHSTSDHGLDIVGHHFEMMARFEGTIPVSLFTIEPQLGVGVAHTSRLNHRAYLGPCERFGCYEPEDQKTSQSGISVTTGVGATYRATRWLGVSLGLSLSSGPLTRKPATDAGMWFFRMALGLKIEV
jgi:hypothetical protein